MTKEAKQLLKELEDFCEVGSPDCTEKFTALCKNMVDSGLLDAELLSEAFQAVSSASRQEGFSDGYNCALEEAD